ncbi:MAG: hypothetical protein ACPLYF_04255, partial [Fervidobacterium sp.]
MVDCGKEKFASSDRSSLKVADICSKAMNFIEADCSEEAMRITRSNSVIARATTKNQQTKRSSSFIGYRFEDIRHREKSGRLLRLGWLRSQSRSD